MNASAVLVYDLGGWCAAHSTVPMFWRTSGMVNVANLNPLVANHAVATNARRLLAVQSLGQLPNVIEAKNISMHCFELFPTLE